MHGPSKYPPFGWWMLAAALLAVNAAAVGRVVWARSWTLGGIGGGPATSSWFSYQKYDGSTVSEVRNRVTGVLISSTVTRPATPEGLFLVWWPVPASLGFTAAVLAIARTGLGRRLLRAVRLPRLTMLHGMVGIGAISVWLWLSKIGWVVLLCGVVVLVLMIHAAFRRARLAKEIGREGAGASTLSRLGLVGYSIAALLALAWVVCTLVWDSYQHGVY